MKILVGIPCLYGPDNCFKAIESVFKEANVLLIDNGAEFGVKQTISYFKDSTLKVFVFVNETNRYVNPAWNQIIEYFLGSDYDQLVIMNSDLVMREGWSDYIQDGISCVPTDGSHLIDTISHEGTTGVFIHLNKEMARLVYPIPDGIRIWYGDTWIYEKIKKAGYRAVIRAGMLCEHIGHGSQTLKLLPERTEIIAQDQLAWAEIVKNL